jgi:tetratricopeptide (TPR) repeat protein
MGPYSLTDAQRLLALSESAIQSLIQIGYLKPARDPSGKVQLSFQDLVGLRAAAALRNAGVSPRRMNKALRHLRRQIPDDLPLSGLSIALVGDRITVRNSYSLLDAESQQYLFAFDVVNHHNKVHFIERTRGFEEAECDAHFHRAFELEGHAPAEAITAYMECLAANEDHPEARTNCGRLLHLAGRLLEAEGVYRKAKGADPSLLFNLAVLLEDLDRQDEAIGAYLQVLAIDPTFADAHFNLARLHEQMGHEREAFRHLLAYRRSLLKGEA